MYKKIKFIADLWHTPMPTYAVCTCIESDHGKKSAINCTWKFIPDLWHTPMPHMHLRRMPECWACGGMAVDWRGWHHHREDVDEQHHQISGLLNSSVGRHLLLERT